MYPLSDLGEIRDVYKRQTPEEPSCVWSTGEEEEIVKYMSCLLYTSGTGSPLFALWRNDESDYL